MNGLQRHARQRTSRVFGRNPLEALVAAGYLDAEDLAGHVSVVSRALADYSDVELAEEILRRAKR